VALLASRGHDHDRECGSGADGDHLRRRRLEHVAHERQERHALERGPQARALDEPLRDVLAGAEEQRLGGGLREADLGADLVVREPAPLSQQQRTPLALGDRAQDGDEVVARRRVATFG
jgi:hypothetical protein